MVGGQWRVLLLDRFEAWLDDRFLVVNGSGQRLVALLALRRRPMSRSVLAGTLWPDKTEERALANLRSALWRLPNGLTEATASEVRLKPGTTCDVDHLVAQARRLREGDGIAAFDIDPALLMCDLLPDWYDEWVMLERERLRQIRLHALEALCAQLTKAGRYAEAIDVGLAAVAAEPFRESASRALILAHQAEGNWAEAATAYRRFRDLIETELGVGPSPLLTVLMSRADSPMTRR